MDRSPHHTSRTMFEFLDCHDALLDIIILIDTTGYTSTSWLSTKTGLKWILEVINKDFPISPNGSHVGLATYNDLGHLVLDLSNGNDKKSITPKLTNSIKIGNTVEHNLAEGLSAAQNEFRANGRSDTLSEKYKQVVIAIINSLPSDLDNTRLKVVEMKSKGINVIPVSISPLVTPNALASASSYPGQNIYTTYKGLSSLWNGTDLVPWMCPYPGMHFLYVVSCFILDDGSYRQEDLSLVPP